jgi:hypothetical protein
MDLDLANVLDHSVGLAERLTPFNPQEFISQSQSQQSQSQPSDGVDFESDDDFSDSDEDLDYVLSMHRKKSVPGLTQTKNQKILHRGKTY